MTYASPALRAPARFPLRIGVTVVLYVIVFFFILPGLLWALGGKLDALLALQLFRGPLVRWVGAGALIGGAGWMAWSMWLLWRTGGGLPISHLPPVRLTTSGPYALMRHPIYVGYVAAFAGAGAVSASPGRTVIMASLLAWGCAIYALGFEESRLSRRYGGRYAEYRLSTPGGFEWPGRFRSWLVSIWVRLRPLAERVANHVVLARIGATTWVTFGVFAAGATLIIGVWLVISLAGAGVPPAAIRTDLIGLTLSIVVGSRLMWLAYRWKAVWADPRVALHQVGFVSWGGLIGLLGFTAFFAWHGHFDVLRLFDIAVEAALAGQVVARIGCFTYGCCYGRPSALGIRWTDPEAKPVREHGAAGGIPRVPTQLLSSVSAALLFLTLVAIGHRGVPPGTVAGLGSLGYGALRFGIECLRADPRFGAWQLTQGQVGCALLAASGIGVLLSIPAASSPPLVLDRAAVPAAAPMLVLCAGLVLVAYGLHWRRVGRW